MNAQEVFNTVVTGLRKQNAVSETPSGGCAYRGEHGRKCAVGMLIPDDEYDPRKEGLRVKCLVSSKKPIPTLVLMFTEGLGSLINAIQWVHDVEMREDERDVGVAFGPTTVAAFAKIAGRFKLDPEAIWGND